MTLEHLFSRSPVLPVDPSISLARYLRTIRQTSAQANNLTEGDSERAALLHIRVLQLICKTLPQHPDYDLPESKTILLSLRKLAHETFAKLEAHADVENEPCAKVRLANGLLDLFRRIVDPVTKVALLAGKVGDVNDVSALVVPSQEAGEVRYETDVLQLAEVKGFTVLGALYFEKEEVPEEARRAVTRFAGGNGFGVVVWEDGYRSFAVREGGVCEAGHVDVLDGTPLFKMYDLRPLAIARDEQRLKDGKG